MKKLLPIGIAAALSVLSASAARAEEAEAGHLVAAWTCGKHVDVELRKYATANYELTMRIVILDSAATAVLATAARVAAQASEPAMINVRLIFMAVPPSLLSVFTRPNYRARYDRAHPVIMAGIRADWPLITPPPPPSMCAPLEHP